MPDPDRTRSWGEYAADLLYDEIGLIEPAVCITHRRFVPCRRDDVTCRISTDARDVAAVRAHQKGEDRG